MFVVVHPTYYSEVARNRPTLRSIFTAQAPRRCHAVACRSPPFMHRSPYVRCMSSISRIRAVSAPHERGQRCVRVRARRGAWDRKPGCRPSTGSASMTASPRSRVSHQAALAAKRCPQTVRHHSIPFALARHVAFVPKIRALATKNRAFVPSIRHFAAAGKNLRGGGSALLYII